MEKMRKQLSEDREIRSWEDKKIGILNFGLLLLTVYCLLPAVMKAEVIERVVAIINDDIILLSELHEAVKIAKDEGQDKNEIEILNEMIDRRLLLKEAERFIPVVKEVTYSEEYEDAVIREYINMRIRPFIRIPISDIESYYEKNRELFKGRKFYDVKDEIEAILTEEALRQRLAEHLRELREKTYIRIQLMD